MHHPNKLTPTPIRILLVDDHHIVLWGLERLIESNQAGMQVVGKATNCAAALDLAVQTSPDVVLLDVDLGIECGVDVIPELIARSNTKVVVLTSLRDSDKHDKAVLAGARGVVAKEDPPENILKAIEKVHQGEFWLDRITTGRIFLELSRKNTPDAISPEQQKISSLTAREREIVQAIANDAGVTTSDFAERLHITKHTLRNHLTTIYEKLGVANRLELYAFANKHLV